MEEGFDRNVIIAIVLSLIVLIGSQYFLAPPPQQMQRAEETPADMPADTPADLVIDQVKDQVGEGAVTRESIPLETASPQKEERLIRVETPLYRAVFSTMGGTIREWRLKSYLEDAGTEMSLMKDDAKIPALSIVLGDDRTMNKTNFSIPEDQGDIILTGKSEEASLTFVYTSGSVRISRRYNFHADGYHLDMTEEVSGIDGYWLTLGSNFGISGIESGSYGSHIGPVLLKDADRIEFKPDKVEEPEVHTGNLRWLAQEDKYFFASIVPQVQGGRAKVWKHRSGEPLSAIYIPSGHSRLLVYSGPKEHDPLKTLGVGLEHIIDFGFFSILARPLFWLMKIFYGFIGNYGWAIVLLTMVVRIPFIPLINKGQKSMKKMQTLQPHMNEIRQKYKKDPQKMQKEMSELYRKYKVNPVGGCLPMLIQIPVFFALYKVLLISIELRGAPFIFWIHDLSAKDPYYILPVVMGVSMFVQQKMTPTPVESQQQKIMQFLPVIFTFMFLNFSSGLVLYWLISNTLSILQQFYNNKKLAAEASVKKQVK